ncbi:MAG: GNAT family N-acetyltransferase [Lachnospiraceae bacterium]|nr:GNAT family N-acetyltransferase [Lachnospiraceae bacterium]
MTDIEKKIISQFEIDTNCAPGASGKININKTKRLEGSRYFADISDFFRAIIFKGRLFMMCDDVMIGWAGERYGDMLPEWFCKYGNLRSLDEKLHEYGHEIMDTHVYFMPDPEYEGYDFECPYSIQKLGRKEIDAIKDNNPFRHALMYQEGCPDELAIAALDSDGEMIAMAGVSSDGRNLWQIGIDVLPEYEHRGLAVYLTTLMKEEVLKRGKVPFYGTSESHSLSQRVAVRSGFVPAWCEIYSRKTAAK